MRTSDDYNICVKCIAGGSPAVGFAVTISDSCAKVVRKQKTDRNGQAFFNILSPGEYCVKAKAGARYSPGAISRWVNLTPNRKSCSCFIFGKIPCRRNFGSLKISLSDKYYPEYKLSQGVYELWRTF